MEAQVDFLEIDAALELVPIWILFSHVCFCIKSKIFILMVEPHLGTHFLNRILFLQKHSLHTLYYFQHCQGTSNVSVGGVISTQKVLF